MRRVVLTNCSSGWLLLACALLLAACEKPGNSGSPQFKDKRIELAAATCRLSQGAVECSWKKDPARTLLPDGSPPGVFTAIPIGAEVTDFDVSPLATHACATTVAGDVYCWGANERGQVGRMSNQGVRVFPPVQVAGLAATRAVATGTDGSCALDDGGHVRCWGELSGAEAHGILDSSQPMEMRVRNARAIASDGIQYCALEPAGAQCWGGRVPDGRGRQVSTDGLKLVPSTRGATSLRGEIGMICATWPAGTETCWSTTYLPLRTAPEHP